MSLSNRQQFKEHICLQNNWLGQVKALAAFAASNDDTVFPIAVTDNYLELLPRAFSSIAFEPCKWT